MSDEGLREAIEALREQLHLMANAMNAMNLKLEVILRHIRRRGE